MLRRSVSVLLACLAMTACGDKSSATVDAGEGDGDGDAGDGGNGSACLQFGFDCMTAADCCSGVCDTAPGSTVKLCLSAGTVCQGEGETCASALDCCGLACTAGATCAADTVSCTSLG